MPRFSVSKSTVIDAPADKVFAAVRDFKQWPAWSPWLHCEPDCRLTYADDGNSYGWDGQVVGAGEIQVTGEEENRSIDHDLNFLKPWKSFSTVRFDFVESGKGDEGTKVTWTMNGSLPFFMFMMKKMMIALIGNDYQRGLGMLKEYVETGSVLSTLDFIGQEASPAFHYVGVETECAIAEIGPNMERDLEKVQTWIEANGVPPAGNPFSIYRKWDLVNGRAVYIAGVPTVAEAVHSSANPPDGSGLITGDVPACEVFSVKHTGPYRHLGNAWSAGIMRSQNKIFRQSKTVMPFETYETHPPDYPENEVVTTVHFPVR